MNQRYYSLDVFRGATVALMILVNNPGSWSHIFAPLAHANWHGATPTDWVFPFFLFAVGNAMAFSLPKWKIAGASSFWKKIIKRTLLIFIIGLLLNWYPFGSFIDGQWVFRPWVSADNPNSGVRIPGVLQRIALCYGFAAVIIYFFKERMIIYVSIIILLLYWLLCGWLGAPGDPYSLSGYFGTAIDRQVLGVAHMYKGEGVPFDPEGITSTLPAIVQVLIGYLAGSFIRKRGQMTHSGSDYKALSMLLLSGMLLLLLANGWNYLFPINKKIWTSSYVLYAGGWSLLILSGLIYLIEFQSKKGFATEWFAVFGKNPLFIFVMSAVVPKTLRLIQWQTGTNQSGELVYTSPLPWLYQHICKPVSENLKWGSLLYAIIFVMFFWALAYWMDRKKIYIKV